MANMKWGMGDNSGQLENGSSVWEVSVQSSDVLPFSRMGVSLLGNDGVLAEYDEKAR